MYKLRYSEEDKWGTIKTVTREEAIEKQKNLYDFFQLNYETDEDALFDFIIANDAYWVEVEEDGNGNS